MLWNSMSSETQGGEPHLRSTSPDRPKLIVPGLKNISVDELTRLRMFPNCSVLRKAMKSAGSMRRSSDATSRMPSASAFSRSRV